MLSVGVEVWPFINAWRSVLPLRRCCIKCMSQCLVTSLYIAAAATVLQMTSNFVKQLPDI